MTTRKTITTSFQTTATGKWWTLTLTAMSKGKLLCLKNVLEAFYKDAPPPSRPQRPAPKFVIGPPGHPSYVVLTNLGPGALHLLKQRLEEYHEQFMINMVREKAEMEKKKAELEESERENPTGRKVLFHQAPERHMLIDEFLDFLNRLPASSTDEDPADGAHMYSQFQALLTALP